METRGHFWNGQWGRLARRDIFVRVDGDRWYVEERAGGAEGDSDWVELDSEDAAVERVRDRIGTKEGWRRLDA